MLPNITLVLGIDAKTIEQLKISWPTWKLNRPEMFNWPWIIFYDHEQLQIDTVIELSEQMGKGLDTQYIAWPPPGAATQYESQRAKMLAGHVYAPALYCMTPWHMKLDTDALARPHERWIEPTWFSDPRVPCFVAPRWHYTKGRGFLRRLDEWGDKAFPNSLPLNIQHDPEAVRVGHARMCSWCSYYRTAFSRFTAEACERTLGKNRLPVPSQDTVHWYVAARLALHHRIENMKARGWSNHPKINGLRAEAEKILGARAEHATA